MQMRFEAMEWDLLREDVRKELAPYLVSGPMNAQYDLRPFIVELTLEKLYELSTKTS